MAKRITELTSATVLAETDVLPVVDLSDTTQATSGTTKKLALSLIADYLKARVETLTNKTLTAPALSSPTISGAWDGWISAGETWTYASADDPTFTFTVAADVTTKYSVGMKIKLTQGTVKYFIITAVSTYSGGNTTITVYGGTDYDLANATISNPYYSPVKCPYGFPMSPDKWAVTVTDSTQWNVLATTGSISNPNSKSITIPIGSWYFNWQVLVQFGNDESSAGTKYISVGLGTTNSSLISSSICNIAGSSIKFLRHLVKGDTSMSYTTKTTIYLNIRNDSSASENLYFLNSISPLLLRAVCAYL